MRRAGDLFREGILASNRANPIGEGAYGVVYQSDVPGRVMKQATFRDVDGNMTAEANRQAIAAELGIAPQVTSLERFPGGIGNRIEMQDIRDNYESLPIDPMFGPQMVTDYEAPGTRQDLRRFAVRQAQQMGQLALKGIEVDDRHEGNVMRHRMTGRPMQLDFGLAYNLSGDFSKANALANATADGFAAAGIPDMGDILRALVADALEGGDTAAAMDIARQGFSRLQKIKDPLKENVSFF